LRFTGHREEERGFTFNLLKYKKKKKLEICITIIDTGTRNREE